MVFMAASWMLKAFYLFCDCGGISIYFSVAKMLMRIFSGSFFYEIIKALVLSVPAFFKRKRPPLSEARLSLCILLMREEMWRNQGFPSIVVVAAGSEKVVGIRPLFSKS